LRSLRVFCPSLLAYPIHCLAYTPRRFSSTACARSLPPLDMRARRGWTVRMAQTFHYCRTKKRLFLFSFLSALCMVRRRSGTSWGCRDEVMECGEIPVINMLMSSFQTSPSQVSTPFAAHLIRIKTSCRHWGLQCCTDLCCNLFSRVNGPQWQTFGSQVLNFPASHCRYPGIRTLLRI
jgi:hypothetical protein